MQPTILLTIDVEDWFQVENFKAWIPFNTWDQYELRVEKNVHRLLDLFDSVKSAGKPEARGQKADKAVKRAESSGHRAKGTVWKTEESDNFRRRRIGSDRFHPESNPDKNKSQKSSKSCQPIKDETNPFFKSKEKEHSESEYGQQPSSLSRPRATFFVLGWIAERLPHLIREIQSRGHEIASHGYYHKLYNQMTLEELKNDLIDSKKLLEDISGSAVYGFRAPSFSVSSDILKTIEDCGYKYDSSYNSFSLHERYGQISLNGNDKKGIANKISENFYELPISNVHFKDWVLPLGGGGYFRLIPLTLFKLGISTILKKDTAYLFYLHPWEIDPSQPKVKKVLLNYKLRHYTKLNKTDTKLTKLIESFSDCSFITCKSYLYEIKNLDLEAEKSES